ncbi:MAG: CRISPR-associated endonuclease Cas1 [Myxococcales bacterium]|nr:MAG: CRISPR-associated endonuclease Cas1 [Myxococcales bacterium]
MLNEFIYCPRLAYLEWAESEFADNAFVLDGRRVHARVDEKDGALPPPADDSDGDEAESREEGETKPAIHSRSVMLSASNEGLIAKIDLVELEGGEATPVDYKRGKTPDVPEGAWEADRVQLCAQGLILRENGYRSERGVVYYAKSKERVEIPFDETLIARTREARAGLLKAASLPDRPPPLHDSPKCDGCSLAGICLPDETLLVEERAEAGSDGLRRLVPARDDALPLYVQSQKKSVGKQDDLLVVKEKGEKVAESRLEDTSQVCLFGNVQISAQALQECCRRGIPICHFSYGGWFNGLTIGLGLRNAVVKKAQFKAADDAAFCLALARRIVRAKIHNQRTMLRRNHPDPPKLAMDALDEARESADRAETLASLLGVEGSAARHYFESFGGMLKAREGGDWAFDFAGRNRRPPRDPVNAMLSFAYSMLAKDCTVAALSAGFDPFQGFYHQPRFGRPALALDLMEEFRPIVADSTVLTLVNAGIVGSGDFVRGGGSVAMKSGARKSLIEAYERRMDQLVTHPVFGYRISYRRVLEVQARLLARHVTGELPDFPAFLPR